MFKIQLIILVFYTMSCSCEDTRTVVSFDAAVVSRLKNALAECEPNQERFNEFFEAIVEEDDRNDPRFMEFIHCGYKKANSIDKDGTVNPYRTSAVFPDRPTAMKIIKECNKIGETPVITTFNAYTCFIHNPFIKVAL